MEDQNKVMKQNSVTGQSSLEDDNSPNPDKIRVTKPPERVTATSKLNRFLMKIRDHFFDFVLLFLAVFCGFMADNWRKTLSEHQREKIFIKNTIHSQI
jgi:hypothetical protein